MNQRELFLRHVAQTSDTPMMGVDVNIVSAKGCVLTDANGKEYIDLISGISVSSVGHCHPKVVEAVQQQSSKFMHLMVYGEFNQAPQVAYAKALCDQLPPTLQSVYFTTGGSEAVEGALKLAKRVTGRPHIVSFKNAYHGSTHGALSVMGSEVFKSVYRPLLPGTELLDLNDTSALQKIDERVAAVIIEPIQGEAGVRKADPAFLKALQQRCHQQGALLIFDEIQSGFARTGRLFAFEHYDCVPDILLLAKGMGGGMPIGAFVASRDLMQHLTHDPILGHINTFGGNAVCAAAALATLKVIIDDNLCARARAIETRVKEKLQHRCIKELRIHGALGAIEFESEDLNFKIVKACLEDGLISDWFLFCSQAMRIAPPLTISDQELEVALDRLLKVFDSMK